MIPVERSCLPVQAHLRHGRIYLSVAPRCNVRCGHCDRHYDRTSESWPGVTSEVILPEAALDHMGHALRLDSRLRTVGVAGPDEPLANPAALEAPRPVHIRFPGPLLYLGISGSVLSDALPGLLNCGVSALTVTVNTRSAVYAGHVYRTVGDSVDAGAVAAFLHAQQEDAAEVVETGLTVKINIIVIPGVNTGGTEGIARWAARAGAAVMSLMSFVPQTDFRGCEPPSRALLEVSCVRARVRIPQLVYCKQCRADAAGVLKEQVAALD